MSTEKAYKLVFAKTGKMKALRAHAKKVMKPKKKDVRVSVPNVMVKISSFGKSGKSVAAHFDYVSRNGKVAVFDSMDNEIGDETETQKKTLNRIAKSIADLDKKEMKNKRLTCNLILSMPPATDRAGFADGVRDFISEEFKNHDYTYAFHDDTDCYHAHICVPMLGMDGKRLNPRKEDLARWRDEFSQSLNRNGISAFAMPAIAQNKATKHESLYKYSKLVEHGKAPYDFNEENKGSYYVKLEDKSGKGKILWSNGLKEAINKADIKVGDIVNFSVGESEEISVRDKDGAWVAAERHRWVGEKQPEKKESKLSIASAVKVVKAWHTVEDDIRASGDTETASTIKAYVRATFGRVLDDKNRGIKTEEEKTR